MEVDLDLAHELITPDQRRDQHYAKIYVHGNTKNADYNKAVKELSTETILFVDMEGVNLGSSGPITLIQIYSPSQNTAHLFDVIADANFLAQGSPVVKILESSQIVKVFHACSNDSAALFCQHKITLQTVFDLQAADDILLNAKGKITTSHKRGFQHLLSQYDCETHPLKKDIKMLMKKDDAVWKIRPLTRELILYGALDVTLQKPLHSILKQKLEENELEGKFEEYMKEFLLHDVPSHRMIQWEEIQQSLPEISKAHNYFSLNSEQKSVVKHLQLSPQCKTRIYYWRDLDQFAIQKAHKSLLGHVLQNTQDVLKSIEKTIEADEHCTRHSYTLHQMSELMNYMTIQSKAHKLLNVITRKCTDSNWKKITQIIDDLREQDLGDSVPTLPPQKAQLLLSLTLGKRENQILLQKNNNLAPPCVIALLREDMLRTLSDIKLHLTEDAQTTMTSGTMNRIIRQCLLLPYPDVRRRAEAVKPLFDKHESNNRKGNSQPTKKNSGKRKWTIKY